MKYRSLGNTGLTTSVVGFGAWGIGGRTAGKTSYGDTDDGTSRRALDRAFDLGINFIDTSPAYGNGHSETLIGDVFRKKREHVVIATKIGYQSWTKPPDFSPNAIRRSVEDSLNRLNTDYIDLLQFHNAPVESTDAFNDSLAAVLAMKQNGLVRSWGMSVKAPLDGVAAVHEFSPDAVQCNINMLDMRAHTDGLLPLVKASGIGLIARTPLCFGFLSGSITEDTRFTDGDHRNSWSKEQIECWLSGSRRVQDAVSPRLPTETGAQSAIRFCLSVPGVSTTIPGIMTPEEAESNAAAADAPQLADSEYNAICTINAETDFLLPKVSHE